MMVRKGLVGAVAAVLAIGSVAWADDSVAGNSPAISLASDTQVVAPQSQDGTAQPLSADEAAAPAPRKPLMNALDKVGLAKPLDSIGINIYGFVEAGYLYDATVPHNITPPRTAPGDLIFFPGPYKDQVLLDQLDLNIERVVDASKGKFDVGFHVEGYYGRDAFFTHSNGILDENNKHGGGQEVSFDMDQAYLTFAVPVGSGLTVKAGKFVTLFGEETINPTNNYLYTHSYEFSYGIPFTQTGILASYNLSDKLSLTGGITRGWNQSSSDNNGAIDFLGEAVYTWSDKLTLTANLAVGPEAFHDNADYFLVPEILGSYKLSDQLTLVGDVLYGFANNIAQWWGIAGYADYAYSSMFSLNARLEYYHDGNGATTGTGNGSDVNFWEVTGGVAVTPLPDNEWLRTLVVRPEVRFDWADQGVYDFSKFNQFSAAVDLIYSY